MLASYWRLRNRTVRVHTTNESSIEGVLTRASRDYLILRGAKFVKGDDGLPLEGEALLPHESIDFLQVL